MGITESKAPPSTAQFDFWVDQSINQAAAAVYYRRILEAGLAAGLGTSYLTQSPFAYDLLRELHGVEAQPQERSLGSLLRMDLPFLRDVDTGVLMRVRNEEGESFANFRSELDRHLTDLDLIEDPAARRKKLANIVREMSESQVRAVRDEMKSVRKKVAFESAIVLASFAGAFYSSGPSALLTVAAAAVSGVKVAHEAKEAPRKLPGFFLWDILNRSSKRGKRK